MRVPELVEELVTDARELTRLTFGQVSRERVLETVVRNEAYLILAIQRARGAARRWHIPGLNHVLRVVQTVVYGVEINRHVELGRGVWFVHPVGTVVGGNSRLGDRVKLMGNNTIGTAKENGFPVIEDDVVVGVGARILGPIHVGARSIIGANAVVLDDVPPDSVVLGIPARSRPRNQPRVVAKQQAPAELAYATRRR